MTFSQYCNYTLPFIETTFIFKKAMIKKKSYEQTITVLKRVKEITKLLETTGWADEVKLRQPFGERTACLQM